MRKTAKKVNKARGRLTSLEWQVGPAQEWLEPWNRQPGESALWFQCFETYRALGIRRTIEQAYRQEMERRGKTGYGQRPNGSWRKIAIEFHWHERAEAWDIAEINRVRREAASEARADKSARIKLLKAARGKLIQALEMVEMSPLRLPELVNAIRMVVGELRNEYDDPISRQVEMSEDELDIAIEQALAELSARREGAITADAEG
jgi:hypothetical protein